MEKPRSGKWWVFCSIIVFFGLIAFSASTAAEFKRTTIKDLRIDGTQCSLPESPAFGLGVAASISLVAAQLFGTYTVGCRPWSTEKEKDSIINGRKKSMAIFLLVLSWISFGLAIILLSGGTSMNRRQPYGDGWLDGECYVVHGGVYIGAAMLGLVNIILIISLIYMVTADTLVQVEQRKIYAHQQIEVK